VEPAQGLDKQTDDREADERGHEDLHW
jgi:hypothetical protein